MLGTLQASEISQPTQTKSDYLMNLGNEVSSSCTFEGERESQPNYLSHYLDPSRVRGRWHHVAVLGTARRR